MRILVNGGTRTLARLAPLYPHRLGHLLSPACGNSVRSVLATGLPYAVDNGAFSPGGFDRDLFTRLLDRLTGHPRPLWVACPDVVADAKATLALWPWWAALVRSRGLPAALVLQDGQESLEVPDADAYFLGGSTRWKLSRASADVCLEARRRGRPLHAGRVNSRRRLAIMLRRGCDSVDGGKYGAFGDAWLERDLLWLAHAEAEPSLPFG